MGSPLANEYVKKGLVFFDGSYMFLFLKVLQCAYQMN